MMTSAVLAGSIFSTTRAHWTGRAASFFCIARSDRNVWTRNGMPSTIIGRVRTIAGQWRGDALRKRQTPEQVTGMPVYDLDDAPVLAAAALRQLLGGKGAGLVEMHRLGIPVPPAFVLGTPLCPQYLASGWSADLDQAIAARLAA